jgi:hypothetical protein
MVPLFSQPSIGDLDQDGTPDVVSAGGSPNVARIFTRDAERGPFDHYAAMWSGKTGRMLPGSPHAIEGYSILASQAIADIDGDDYPEVIASSSVYLVHAIDACGREPEGWPKLTNGWALATPAVGDIDSHADHTLEVVAATREGYLFAWHTRGHADGVVAWESFHHDNANTGDYGAPLAQGTPKRATTPIACNLPASAPNDVYTAGGCALAPGRASHLGGALAALLIAARLRRSRRRDRDAEHLS